MRSLDLDLVRFLALIGIVTLHVDAYYWFSFFSKNHNWWLIANFFDGLSRWAVPVFFMTSGYLLLSNTDSTVDFYKKRFTRILYPFLFWSSIYFLLSSLHQESSITLSSYFEALLSNKASYHLWFIYALIGIYLITPFIKASFQSDDSNSAGLIFLTLWFVGLCFQQIISKFYGLNLAVDLQYFYWPLGYFVAGFMIGKIAYKKSRVIIAFTGAIALIVFSFYLVNHFTKIQYLESGSVKPASHYYLPTFPVIAIHSILVFYLLLNLQLGKHINKPRLKHFIFWLGKESYGVYLIHLLFVNVLLSMLTQSKTDINPIFVIPSVVFISIFSSYITIYFLKKLFALIGLEKIIS